MPLFAYHGKLDFKIPFKAAFAFIPILEEAGFNVTSYVETKLGHTVNEEELEKLKEFFNKIYGKES